MSRNNLNKVWIGCTVISEMTVDILKCFPKNFRYCLGDRMLDYILGAVDAASRMLDLLDLNQPYENYRLDCIHNLRMLQVIMKICLARDILTPKQLTNLTKEIVPVWEILNDCVQSESL